MYTTAAATLLQTGIRTVSTMFLAPRFGITGIAFACMIGWPAMLLFEVPYYFATCRRQGLPKQMTLAKS